MTSGRFRLDPSYRRPGAGAIIVAGSPLRLFRLTAAGVGVAERLEGDGDLPPGHERLTDRLLDAGAIHPMPLSDGPLSDGPLSDGPFDAEDVTIVVPARDETPALPPRLQAHAVIVVDDASAQPLRVERAQRVVRLAANVGPGGARNAGLAEVDTAIVAFVDTDVTLPAPWPPVELLAHFADTRVALVAPRVRSPEGRGVRSRYERLRSPLDLGGQPARIAVGSRVGYVPAAALVCRVGALREIGGFCADLRCGEDVDLVWRLAEAGWRCRYEPDSRAAVVHRPRPTWWAWCKQRFAYGSSAAPLARRHAGALAPLRISGWSLGVWTLVVLRRPAAAIALGGLTAVALRRKLADVPAATAWRLAWLGNLFAGRQIAGGIRRAWWPIAAAAGVCSRRARPVVLAVALGPSLIEWATDSEVRRTFDPARWAAIRLADDVAYGAGLWWGVLRTGELGPLLPDLTKWPPRTSPAPAAR